MPDNPDFSEMMMGDAHIHQFPEPPPDQLRGFALELAVKSYAHNGPTYEQQIVDRAKRFTRFISTGE